MTSPEDDDPEEALRRALSEAVSGVEPGADGLDKVRARIGNRPPRPWPLSALFGVIDRVRNWTWHGHWAWQDSLPRPSASWRPRSRRRNFPGWGTRGLRLVTVLAGIAIVAGISLGVSPFRNAILQASTTLHGGNAPPRPTAGTEGNGTRTADGGSAADTPTAAAVARQVAGRSAREVPQALPRNRLPRHRARHHRQLRVPRSFRSRQARSRVRRTCRCRADHSGA